MAVFITRNDNSNGCLLSVTVMLKANGHHWRFCGLRGFVDALKGHGLLLNGDVFCMMILYSVTSRDE